VLGTKDQKILDETKDTEEPVIVFRAKDALALEVLLRYAILAEQAGCPADFIVGVTAKAAEFALWRSVNVEKVRTPD
jgi:hypothetical protein